ncbi:hypothetical protein Hypma_009627 [Hypsizygus marmoreus]|uniref:Cyclin N-terminal domain-containing protein n=1 Tax=Hypsizygus marmoreus TaxID=39966 RepID=A0A369JV35_HYPMA|nr:hypothetical protein Hypma_009627 [Hypsizygus marmoreus]
MPYQLYPLLRSRPNLDARMSYYNRPKFLVAPDASLLPPVVDSVFAKGTNDTYFHSRAPLQKLNNLVAPVTATISAKVAGTWATYPNHSTGRAAFDPLSAAESDHPVEVLVTSGSNQRVTEQPKALVVSTTSVKPYKATAENQRPPHPSVTRLPKRRRTPYPSNDEGDISRHSSTFLTRDPIHKRLRTSGAATSQAERDRVAIQEKIRHERTKLHPFAEWLSDHLHALLVVQDRARPMLLCPVQEIVISKLLDILVQYRPEASIVFLALWYLSRLFPQGLVSCYIFQEYSTEIIARVFLLGLTFATKWLDDLTRKNGTWMRFCSLEIKSINQIEKSALVVLDYNLHISNGEWEAWLLHLLGSTAYFKTAMLGQLTAFAALNEVISVAEKGHPKCVRQPPAHCFFNNLNFQLLQDLSPAHADDLPSAPTVIPDPAPWNPAADPIITPCRRVVGAVGIPSVGIIGRRYESIAMAG